jgi:hypothetical protein
VPIANQGNSETGRGSQTGPGALGRQWSAFITARIRDLAPDGHTGHAACQLCQGPLPASHPHVLDIQGCAVVCACHCCYLLYRWAVRDEQPGRARSAQGSGPSRGGAAVACDREEGAEDGPGKQDGQATGLCHCWDSRAGLSWSRRTEMSIRGRLNAVI